MRTHDSEDDTARLRVFGFLVQYEGAKLEWDVLAIGGTTIDSLMKRGDTAVEAYLSYRKPDLAMIWYGTNSLNNPRLKVVRYAKRYRAILDRLAKAAPDAACVVLGPTDFMKRDRDCFSMHVRGERDVQKNDLNGKFSVAESGQESAAQMTSSTIESQVAIGFPCPMSGHRMIGIDTRQLVSTKQGLSPKRWSRLKKISRTGQVVCISIHFRLWAVLARLRNGPAKKNRGLLSSTLCISPRLVMSPWVKQFYNP